MANVIQRKDSWYVKYKDGKGRWKREVTTATSKTEAKRLAVELEQKAERERSGLEANVADCTMTLGELCQWWLDNRCPAKSLYGEQKRLGKHVLRSKLGGVQLRYLSANDIETQLRSMEKDGLGAHSLNGFAGPSRPSSTRPVRRSAPTPSPTWTPGPCRRRST